MLHYAACHSVTTSFLLFEKTWVYTLVLNVAIHPHMPALKFQYRFFSFEALPS